MDTWSGSLIGARKYCDNATRRWSIATRLLAWTAEIDIKSTSYKLQATSAHIFHFLDCRAIQLSSCHLKPGALLRHLSFICLLLFNRPCDSCPVSNIHQHQSTSFCNMSGCHRLHGNLQLNQKPDFMYDTLSDLYAFSLPFFLFHLFQ